MLWPYSSHSLHQLVVFFLLFVSGLLSSSNKSLEIHHHPFLFAFPSGTLLQPVFHVDFWFANDSSAFLLSGPARLLPRENCLNVLVLQFYILQCALLRCGFTSDQCHCNWQGTNNTRNACPSALGTISPHSLRSISGQVSMTHKVPKVQ